MEYYYPENLAAKTLIANYWSFRDIMILAAIFAANILIFIIFKVFFFIVFFVLYAFGSMKIARGYSITKLAILYIRFLFTDQLKFFWRLKK